MSTKQTRLGTVFSFFLWLFFGRSDFVRDSATPLRICCTHFGRERLIETLVAFDADINVRNKYGETALVRAVHRVQVRYVKLLLQLNVDTANVVQSNNEEIRQLLLDHLKQSVRFIYYVE
jgi:ankyrin repeat protein